MSIYGEDEDNEMVRLPGLWEVLAKFAFAASVPVLLLGVSWAVWMTTTVMNHTTDIRVLQVQIDAQTARVRSAPKMAALKELNQEGGE